MSYDPHPLPLTAKQKFVLAERFTFDPVSFGLTGLAAGVQQGNNDYKGFGQGASGYGKRYAAATGTLINSTIIGGAILPALLHQDPRYFYKGTGSIKSRTLYAIANAVICKGDNGHWQFNASSIGGGLAAGGISNFYYPKADRDGVESTFVEFAIGLAENAGRQHCPGVLLSQADFAHAAGEALMMACSQAMLSARHLPDCKVLFM